MRIQAVLFDKDGTLFDFQKTWAPWVGHVITILSDGDAGLANQISRAWGYDLAAERILPGSIVIAGHVGQVAAAIQPLVPAVAAGDLLALLDDTGAVAEGVEVLPLAGFLDTLTAQGRRIGIATNDSETTARSQLARVDAHHRFDFIAGYDSGHGAKPDPGMCLAFAAHVNMDPERVVMVGDSTHDLEAGRAAGMACVGVLTGVAEHGELEPFADVLLPDIGGLFDWLD